MSDLGRICKHDSLARSCELCERDEEIARLTAERNDAQRRVDGLRAALDDACVIFCVSGDVESAAREMSRVLLKARMEYSSKLDESTLQAETRHQTSTATPEDHLEEVSTRELVARLAEAKIDAVEKPGEDDPTFLTRLRKIVTAARKAGGA